MDIKQLRIEIDKIDKEIVGLFESRMKIAGKIGEYKKANGLALYDAKRERELLDSKAAMLKDSSLEPYVRQFFKTIMELSKGLQFQNIIDKNIVLIGIMGSGKSSNGRILAERIGMSYVDVDEEIEKEQNMTISEIFERYGKFKFRELESKKIAEISSNKKQVISTGGGAVLSDSNMEKLKSNGIIIFLNRSIDEIVKTIDTSSRPLLADGAQRLYEIYNERLPLYKKWCDIEVCENSSIESVVDEIIKKLG